MFEKERKLKLLNELMLGKTVVGIEFDFTFVTIHFDDNTSVDIVSTREGDIDICY